jgi:hypothetical protein
MTQIETDTGATPGKSGTTVTEQVKQQTQQVTQQAQETAQGAIGQASQQTKSVAQDQKQKASESLTRVAQALHATSQQLQEQGQGPAGQMIDTAAQRLERVAGYLQARDISQLIGEVEGFARRQPPVFLGGAFVLGLALSRFLKSSPADGGSSGGRQSGMPQGRYDIPSVPYPSEEVQGTPEVQIGYAPGPAGVSDGTIR